MSPDYILTFFQRIWVDGDVDAIDRMFSADARAAGFAPDLVVGPEDFHVLVPALRALVEDISVQVDHAVVSGDWLWSLVRVSARAADSGRPVLVTGQVMARIQDDKVVEAYNHFDWIMFYEALDLLPPQTMAMCMAGQRIF